MCVSSYFIAESLTMTKRYPDIMFSGNANREFENMVRIATHKTQLYSDIFPEWEKQVYRLLEETGQEVSSKNIQEIYKSNKHTHTVCSDWLLECTAPLAEGPRKHIIPADFWFYNHLGHEVFKEAKKSFKREFYKMLLKNNVFFNNYCTPIDAHFSALEEIECINKREVIETCYVSPVRPRVKINGKDYIFGYTIHAIERLAERICPVWRSYVVHTDTFRILHDCRHLVGCEITHNGCNVPCVSIFKRLSYGYSYSVFDPYLAYLSDLVESDVSGQYVRLGYCPVFIYDEYAIANTLLIQGYTETPEAQLYISNQFDSQFQNTLKEIGKADDAHNGLTHTHPALLEIFHKNGYPQVLLGSDPQFAHITNYNPHVSDCAPGRIIF